jgi:hypothetical protein
VAKIIPGANKNKAGNGAKKGAFAEFVLGLGKWQTLNFHNISFHPRIYQFQFFYTFKILDVSCQ